MTRRTVLRGLWDVPFDRLLVPWGLLLGLAQWQTSLVGQTVTRVRGEVVSTSSVPLAVEVRERLLLTVLVTLFGLVVPALVRRSIRTRGAGRTRRGMALLDDPFHRDLLFWLVLVGLLRTALANLPQAEFQSGSSGIDRPYTADFVVRDGYGVTLFLLGIGAAGSMVFLALASALRDLYRAVLSPAGWGGVWRRRLGSRA